MSNLTDLKLRTAKPEAKPYKLQDGKGLYLEVRPSGVKVWRYRYWITPEREGIYTIGNYPYLGLAEARKEREWAREQVKMGLNPTHVKKMNMDRTREENADTFEALAIEWQAHNTQWTDGYRRQVKRVFDADLIPALGKMPIRKVTPPLVLDLLQGIRDRGAPSIAVLSRQWIGQMFRYAASTMRADTDPTQPLMGAIKKPPVRHNPPLSAEGIPIFLIKLDGYAGYTATKLAMRLMLLTFVRTIEMRYSKWDEIDLDNAMWRIPLERMKTRKKMMPGAVHMVPLSTQAVDVLRQLYRVTGSNGQLLPNMRDPNRCMSATTINRALERMGYLGQFSAHGFRSTASTLLHERGYNTDVIEKQLAHMEKNKVKGAYNHAAYLPARVEMMQGWADWIDELEAKARADAGSKDIAQG